MQLQENYEQIQSLNAEVLAVFREEKLGVDGLIKSREKSGSEFPLLLDLGAERTAAYSQSGFHTYVIDRQGKILAILEGTVMKRATVEGVLEALQADPS